MYNNITITTITILATLFCIDATAAVQDSLHVSQHVPNLDSLHVSNLDSLHVPNLDSLTQKQISTLQKEPRKTFFRRLINYFSTSTVDRTFEKKMDFTFIGGPSYSETTSLGIGVLAAGMYRLDRSDSITPPSDISIYLSASINGFYSLGLSGNNIFSGNKSRIDYTASFSSTHRYFWGIGYHAGAYNEKSKYIEQHSNVQARYLKQIFKSFYIGGKLNFRHTKGTEFGNINILEGENRQYTSLGVGILFEYDTRDFIPNPYRGVYISLQETFYPKFMSDNGLTVRKAQFTFDYYQKIWKGGVLAFDFYLEQNTNGTPWPLLARMGGSYRMRGYYEGQYIDNNMATTQLELRQKVYRRIGFTLWAGAGNVFSTYKSYKWSETLPNYGVGLRWEVKKRMNVRVDYGFGKNSSGLMLNISEAF